MKDPNDEHKTGESDFANQHSPASSENPEMPLSTAGAAPPLLPDLSPQQWALAEELARLDPQLVGLYRAGLELLLRLDEPGISYMVAHAGRELSRGVISLLAETDATLPDDTTTEIPDNERNRGAIGAILQLAPGHSLVTKWFRIHTTFVRFVHFRQPGLAAGDLREAFLGLSELLFGRIGPYFATQEQLDALLLIDSPDEAEVERVRHMLLRPVQRRYFFSSLMRPGWLAPLAASGLFANPPEVRDAGNGTWHLMPWPEGEYLVRMASHEPEIVTNILLRVPSTLKNPAVWDVVARAAAAMPAEFAKRLTGSMESGLKTPLSKIFSFHVIPVVRKLAEAQRSEAFSLAVCLLWLNRPLDEEAATSTDKILSRRDTEWVLTRLESYALGQFIKEAVPALEAFKPDDTLELLSKTLNRATWLVEQATGTGTTYLRGSTYWCRRLDHVRHDNDVRAQLAVALAGVATQAASVSEERALQVLAIIGKYEHEIFQRIRIAVLTSAGQVTREPLDDLISNSQILDSPPSRREYAALLRAQFDNASPRAQHLFTYALKRGPEPERVKASLAVRNGDPADEGVSEIVAAWQRQRLLWFHDQIPELLLPIAEQLGVEQGKTSEEERALNEEGFYVRDGGWEDDPSAIPDEQLATIPPDTIISYLESSPTAATVEGQGPTVRGLAQTLSKYASARPDAAEAVANKLIAPTAIPSYVSALLGGFNEALEKGHAIPWPKALELASFAVKRADEVEREAVGSDTAREWGWASGAAARLIEKGCSENYIPDSESDAVWRILGDAFASASTWARSDESEDFKTFYSVLSAALNTLSGRFVKALIDAALWEYRRAHPGEDGKVVREASAVTQRLVPLLERILNHGGHAGLAAHAMLGHYIPYVLLMARAWTLEFAGRLFEGGAASPKTRPIWGAYITRSVLYSNVFQDLRPWYVVAADAASAEEGADSQDREWSPSRRLVVHVLTAVLRGLAAVGDADGLVETTFSNTNISDRVHAYWEIYRVCSDNDGKGDQDFMVRLVRFWEWRLDQLEAADNQHARAEEASGLRWLLATPHIPAVDAVRLGKRTIELIGDETEDRGVILWDRLAELSESDARGTYEIAEMGIHKTLSHDYPYLPFDRVAPALKRALKSGDDQIIKRAERLIHTLGDRGFFDFGKLLSRDDASE
jgi:hypothetical protein